jgi:OOP family OmpA-OmpF porin
MFKPVAIVSTLCFGLGLAVGIAHAQATAKVEFKDFMIVDPTTLTVAPGTTVTWINNDGSNHFVKFADAASPRLKHGATWSRTFSAPGTYAYACSIHPQMAGTVVVK